MATGTLTSRDQQIQYYASLLDQNFGGKLTGSNMTMAQYYIQYLEKNPSADPGYTYSTIAERLVGLENIPTDLGGSITGAIGKTGQVVGAIGPGVGAGAQAVSPITNLPGVVPGLTGLNAIGDFASRLTEKQTWIRIGEAVVAIVLLDVGLKAFTGTSVIESTGKKITGGTKAAAKTAIFK